MRFVTQVWLNDGPGALSGYQPGDKLVRGPTVTVEAETEVLALDVVWEAGNIGTQWSQGPRRLRSLSTGDVLDVIKVGDEPGVRGKTWTIDGWGFSEANPTALKISFNERLAKVKDPSRYLFGGDPIEPVHYQYTYDGSTAL